MTPALVSLLLCLAPVEASGSRCAAVATYDSGEACRIAARSVRFEAKGVRLVCRPAETIEEARR